MSQPVVLILLLLGLGLPILGAVALRLLGPRLSAPLAYGLGAGALAIAVASVLVLSRSNIGSLQLGGVSVLLADNTPVEVPDLPATSVPDTLEPPVAEAPTVVPATAEPATAAPSEATAEPTAAPTEAPTAEPTAEPTPEPTAEPTPEPAPEEPAQAGPPQFRVIDTGPGGVRVRGDPSLDQAPIKTLPEGTIVTVIGDDVTAAGYTWKNIRDPDGEEGWIAQDFLEPAP